jgi:hypothetical protein
MAIAHARPARVDDPTTIALTPEVARALTALLRRARRAEDETTGPTRRRAFRNSRHLLGGMRALGVPTRFLADTLGVTIRSVRTRAETDGPIRLDDFRRLIGASVAGSGADGRAHADGDSLHPASALVVAFLDSITQSEGDGTRSR